jgi:ADP-heptose:LPS heptosyltransferase
MQAPRRVALFRALVLGDVLCAVPAWRAMRAAWPQAELTLVGLPWAEPLVERLSCLDRFIAFPGWPGLPEGPIAVDALPGFLARVQAERFDLAVQMHGSGGLTNPLVAAFGAARTAGFHQPPAFCPDPAGFIPWPAHGHEIERCLALAEALGAPRLGRELEFPVRPEDDARLLALWPGAQGPFAIVHAGSQLPSRRWPVERFAQVADALVSRGLQVVLTGTKGEAPIARAVAASARTPLIDLVGRTDLWTLGALVARARLVVANDTGISHIASALRTPSVIVSLGSDVSRWAPLDSARHRVLWQDLPCRPCAHAVCPTAHECALAIPASTVIAAAEDLLQPTAPAPCPPPENACAS